MVTGSAAEDLRLRQVHAAETRLLYENASTGVLATVVIASLLVFILDMIAVQMTSLFGGR